MLGVNQENEKMMEEYERLASEVNDVLLHQKPSNYDKIRDKPIIFADMLS